MRGHWLPAFVAPDEIFSAWLQRLTASANCVYLFSICNRKTVDSKLRGNSLDMANLIHVAIWQPQWRIKPLLEKDVDAGPKGGHEGHEWL
jgi:hypothetical protein